MIKKNIIKRTCAGILAFLMVCTSNPVSAYADVDDVENDIVEDAVDDISVEEDEAIEDGEYYSVDISFEHINQIDYVFGYQSGDRIIANKDEGDYYVDNKSTNPKYYSIKVNESKTTKRIEVPKDRPYLIIKKLGSPYSDAPGSGYVAPIVTRMGKEVIQRTKTNSNVYYSNNSQIYNCFVLYIGNDVAVENPTETDPTVDFISVKCNKTQNVNIALQNIKSFDYTIAQNLGRVEECFGTGRTATPGSIKLMHQEFSSGTSFVPTVNSTEIPIPNGYTLAIWNVEKSADKYGEPIVMWDGEPVALGTDNVTIDGVSYSAYEFFAGDSDEGYKQLKNMSIKSVPTCDFKMHIDKKTKAFKYVIVTPEEMKNYPVSIETSEWATRVKEGVLHTDTEDDLYGYGTLAYLDDSDHDKGFERVEYGNTIIIFDIEMDGDAPYELMQGSNPVSANVILVEGDDLADPDKRFEGYSFKIIEDKSDLSIESQDIADAVIALENINRITYVIAKNLDSIPETSIREDVIVSGETEKKIGVPKGYSLILLDVVNEGDDKYEPVKVLFNNEEQKVTKAIGTIVKTTGTRVSVDGILLCTSDGVTESSGIKISSKPKVFDIKIATFNGEELSYAYAASEAALKKTIKAALEGEEIDPTDEDTLGGFAKTAFVTNGATTEVGVPLNYYFAIYRFTPNKGCYADEEVPYVVKKSDKKYDTFIVTADEVDYMCYNLGKITGDITGVRADVNEAYYDVTLFTQDVASVSYVIAEKRDTSSSPLRADITEIVTVEPTSIDPGDYDPQNPKPDKSWLDPVAYGDSFKYYNYVNAIPPEASQVVDKDEDGGILDKDDHIKPDQVPLKNYDPTDKSLPNPATKYGFVKIHKIPAGREVFITEFRKIETGTKLEDNYIYINGTVVRGDTQVNFKTGEKLEGWDLGAVSSPFPKYQLDKIEYDDTDPDNIVLKAKNYSIVSNLVLAESRNYRMQMELYKGPQIDVGYVDGFYIKKSTEGGDYYYTDDFWNEDKSDFTVNDLVFELSSKTVDYNLFAWNKYTEDYVLTADVCAIAYMNDGKNPTDYSEPFDLKDTFEYNPMSDKARFTLDSDQIRAWLTNPDMGYTHIQIKAIPWLEVKFPTVDIDSMEVYKYEADFSPAPEYPKVTIAKYKEDGEKIEPSDYVNDFKNEKYTKARWGDSFEFVIVPAGDVDEPESIVSNFVVDDSSVKEAKNAKLPQKVSYPNTYIDDHGVKDFVHYYTLAEIKRSMAINASLRTKTGNIKFKVKNYTELQYEDDEHPNDQFGKASIDPIYNKDVNINIIGSDSVEALYEYTVAQNVTNVTLTITEENKYAQLILKLNGKEVKFDKHTGNTYKYIIPAITFLQDECLIELENRWETRDFYMLANPNEVNVSITARGKSVETPTEDPVSGATYKAGYVLYHYVLPVNEDSIINVRAKDNCRVKNVLINYSKKNLDYAGNYKYRVTGNNNPSGSGFIVDSEALRTLYFGEGTDPGAATSVYDYDYAYEAHPTNKYTVEVAKEKAYAAYIRLGDEGKVKLPVTDTQKQNIKVTAKIGSADWTKLIVVKDDIMYFNLADKNVAGKTVNVTVKDGTKTIATLNLKVTPYATTVNVKGEKNGVITQDLLSNKTYNVTFNKGVKSKDIAAVFQYQLKSGAWETFDDSNNKYVTADGKEYKFFEYDSDFSRLTIRANGKMDLIKNMEHMPKFQVLFYDMTSPFFKPEALEGKSKAGLVKTKAIDIKSLTLANTTPSVKLMSATDLELNLSVTAPKSYVAYHKGEFLTGDKENYPDVPGLYYVVTARAVDKGTRPTSLVDYQSVCIPAAGSVTAVKLDLANPNYKDKDGVVRLPNAGEGAAWKYTVTVREYYGPIENTDPGKLNYTFLPEYGISKVKQLNNLSTKNPYHETKLGIKAVNNKIIQGQKGIVVAQAKFSAQTTFFKLTPKLVDAMGKDVEGVTFRQGVADDGENPADIYLDAYDFDKLSPGSYKLLVYPDPESNAASIPVTVYEGIRQDEEVTGSHFYVTVPSDVIYRKDKTAATMTAKVKFDKDAETGKYPKSQKVTWSIERPQYTEDDDATKDNGFDITKYVSISNGKVTVSKAFEYQERTIDNQFYIVATAADYVSSPERVAKQLVTINRGDAKVAKLKLYKGGDTSILINPDANGMYKYTSDAYTDDDDKLTLELIGGALSKNCSIKSSNTSVIKVVGPGTARTFILMPVGIGKSTVTVTSLDGSKSTNKVVIEVLPKSHDQLGINLGTTSLTAGVNSLALTSIQGKRVAVTDDSGDELTGPVGLSNYSLSLSGGAKIVNLDGEKYINITGPVFSFKLVDRTKKRTDPVYSQTFTVKLSDYDYTAAGKPITESLGLSLKGSTITAGSGSVVKVSGIKNKEDLTYQVEFVPDWLSMAKMNDGATYYDNLQNSLVDDGIVSGGVDLKYAGKPYSAFVPDTADPIDALKLVSGTKCIAKPGTYQYRAYFYHDGNMVCSKAVKISVKAPKVPTFDIINAYTLEVSGSEVEIELNNRNCKYLLKDSEDPSDKAYEFVSLDDASIKGKVDIKATDYFNRDISSGKITVDNAVTDLVGKHIYCNLTYKYYDMTGKCYEKTELVDVYISY